MSSTSRRLAKILDQAANNPAMRHMIEHPRKPLSQLRECLQPNGTYILDFYLRNRGGTFAYSKNLPDFEFDWPQIDKPTEVHTLTQILKLHLLETYGIVHPRIYLKRIGQDEYIDGEDEQAYLRDQAPYKLVIVPEGCTWRPPTAHIVRGAPLLPRPQ